MRYAGPSGARVFATGAAGVPLRPASVGRLVAAAAADALPACRRRDRRLAPRGRRGHHRCDRGRLLRLPPRHVRVEHALAERGRPERLAAHRADAAVQGSDLGQRSGGRRHGRRRLRAWSGELLEDRQRRERSSGFEEDRVEGQRGGRSGGGERCRQRGGGVQEELVQARHRDRRGGARAPVQAGHRHQRTRRLEGDELGGRGGTGVEARHRRQPRGRLELVEGQGQGRARLQTGHSRQRCVLGAACHLHVRGAWRGL
mmetsp:Transcript_126249/g.365464  ORF Transcript_126249/g.365464 Transcript_126249/m.365464 type:complete len:258 (-) Transcript_126249:396-1169(-)